MKIIKPGTSLHVKDGTRVRHAIVKTVATQDAITVSIGHGTAKSATRGASTATRGTIFTTA